MFTQTGHYYSDIEIDISSSTRPIEVLGCGHFILLQKQKVETIRPRGRRDWQIIYIKSGSGEYLLNGTQEHITQGHIVLYRPHEPQHYVNYLKDSPDIYWIHFTGFRIEQLMNDLGYDGKHLLDVGIVPEYAELFDKIISELQTKQYNFEGMAAAYLLQLLSLFLRKTAIQTHMTIPRTKEIDDAVQIFHQNFNQPFSISEYASSCNMSPRWFTQLFTRQIGISPQQYLTNIRMQKACELLTLSGAISEISALLGYQNPLYFSRIFKKHVGMSPSEYHKKVTENK